MFDAYAAYGDESALVSPRKVAEWEAFRQFLAGDISKDEYYADNSTIRSDVETVAHTLGRSRFEEYRTDLNAALYQRIQAGKHDRHWKEEAADPQNRMYFDTARLINKKLIQSVTQWELNKFMAPDRASYEAQVDDKIAEGFDEALLSPDLNTDNFNGFVANVIRKRIIDFHRVRLGRSEASREKRPHFTSLENPIYDNGSGKTVSMRDTLGAEPEVYAHLHAIDGAALIAQIQRFAESLPTRRHQVLTTFLEEKERDDEATFEDMAAKIGMTSGTFQSHMHTIREQLIEFNPALKKDVIRFFGATPELIRRMDAKHGVNGQAIHQDDQQEEAPIIPLISQPITLPIGDYMPELQTTAIERRYKDPDEILIFGINWADYLDTDTILTSSWTVPAGVTQVNNAFTDTLATIKLSSGTLGQVYRITNRITTSAGETVEKSLDIEIAEK